MAEEKIKMGPYEQICYAGARALEDKTIVFAGTGLPMLACLFAQRTWAPDMNVILCLYRRRRDRQVRQHKLNLLR